MRITSTLSEWANLWRDEPDWHKFVHESFVSYVNQTPELKEHRDFVETHIWGLGERSFQWAWKLLVDEMPDRFSFLEVGVHRGQIVSLIGLLSKMSLKFAGVVGVSEYNGKAMGLEGDFIKDVRFIWDKFVGDYDAMFIGVEGDSRDPGTVAMAADFKGDGYDMVYIDGSHDYESVVKDMDNYIPMLRRGGFLVMDDSANSFNQPWGYFCGIEGCSRAVDERFPPKKQSESWKWLFNVMHLRIFQKIGGDR